MANPLTKIGNFLRRHRELKAMPLRLEFIVSDYCNLNCRGCTHYSPMAPKVFVPLAELEGSIRHLAQACGSEVESAYLIGGETLLYPDLEGAMAALRGAFPSQKLYVFTNGLVLPKMPDSFWQTAADNNITLAVTRYPVKFDYDALPELCRAKEVEVEFFGDRSLAESFFRFPLDPEGRQNARMAHFKCYNRGCISVTGGYVYPCSISACVSHLNKAAGTRFEHRPGDRIAVEDVKSSADIRRLRDNPVPFCRYCCRPESVPYALSKRSASEWVND